VAGWKYYLVAIFAGIFASGFFVDLSGRSHFALHAVFNTAEVALAAFALKKRSTALPHFIEQLYLLRFTAGAVLGAPAAIAILVTSWHWITRGAFSSQLLVNWISTDALGIAVVTPACVSVFRSHLALSFTRDRHWLLLASLVPITLGAFGQSHIPMIFLIYPTVGLILFRFGLGWAAVSTLFITAVGSSFTIHGIGPFAVAGSAISRSPAMLLQLYIASGMFLVLSAASVLETLRATERQLRETAYLHDLVTENSRDIIILANFDGRRSYVSAAASEWGGWKREELLGMNSLHLVHPDDRPKADAIVRNIRTGGDGDLLECRVQDKHGQYVWVEANLRPVRDPNGGAPIGILNMVRDISQRKKAEDELNKAYSALEVLAVTDPLTHLANRRSFDQSLAKEWRRGIRDRLPLSLLILDVDWFKSYNDTYGHPQGDTCLRQIAESVLDVVTRAGDIAARIGGEEFAVILPNTANEGAMQLAKLISASLSRRGLPHNTNPVGFVTISIGCATVVPLLGQSPTILMQQADNALYAAKHAGRNQVCNASEIALNQESMRMC
jgi:diguanylate cyclase (GGDEF)-like protein/PAS domain S-box-containing protein